MAFRKPPGLTYYLWVDSSKYDSATQSFSRWSRKHLRERCACVRPARSGKAEIETRTCSHQAHVLCQIGKCLQVCLCKKIF